METGNIQDVLSSLGLPLAQVEATAEQVAPKAKSIAAGDNLRLFGDLIAMAEGTGQYGPDSYRVGLGGRLINSLEQHPDIATPFTQTDGKKNVSTAAGKYQFIKSTWDDLSRKTGVKDFSPASQERNFQELLRRKKVLKHVEDGDFNTAIQKLGGAFASLPSSKYKQNKRSWEWMSKTAKSLGITGIGVAGYKPPVTVPEDAILRAVLPSKEENLAIAAIQEEQANRAIFDAEQQLRSEAVMQRKSEIDAMLDKAFNFDAIFAESSSGVFPSDYDDKLMKIVEAV